MKLKKICNIMALGAVVLSLAGCSASSNLSVDDTKERKEEVMDGSYPIQLKHKFGETIIETKPNRIVSVSWGNQDVPLSLGVVPVGVSQANYGVNKGENLLPWTLEKFRELGNNNPNVFKDTDGLDYEAISDANPDLILAAYSGITEEEYNILSQIAPVAAYKDAPWQTLWREQIFINSEALGMKAEGEALVDSLEKLITEKTTSYPQLKDKTAAFFYFNPSDFGKFYVYLPTDPRAAYLTDLGFEFSESISKLGENANSFTIELSAENADILKGIDIIVAYGNEDLLKALQKDPLLGKIEAVKNGAVALIEDGTPLAASGTPSALSIPATIDEYLEILGKAADKVQ